MGTSLVLKNINNFVLSPDDSINNDLDNNLDNDLDKK